MAKKDTKLRQSIPVHKRVAVALWWLATGDTYRSSGLQFGVADVSFRFLDISAGYPGSIHDARVLRLSNLHREIEQGNWLNRPTRQISGSEIRPLLVGDSAYPLSAYGILKGRWSCLYKAMEEKTSIVAITILACCVLHNICIDVGDPSPIDILGDDDNDMDQSLNGDVSPIASDVRDKIMDYLPA
nr:uncharacterized protein LOC131783070 [Pocillopora verrucosa]